MAKSSSKTTQVEEGTPPPRRPVNPLYELLREGKIREFNQRVELGERVDLKSCDFRGIDLRGMDPTGIDFSGCYFRQSDLRGVDFRKSVLEGASINGARISGAYFPSELTAEELRLSLNYGIRMRYSLAPAPVIITAAGVHATVAGDSGGPSSVLGASPLGAVIAGDTLPAAATTAVAEPVQAAPSQAAPSPAASPASWAASY